MNSIYQEALNVFSGNDDRSLVSRVNGGLINQSWHIQPFGKPAFLLQRINTNVFRDPAAVQNNYISIWVYSNKAPGSIRLPHPIFFDNQQSLFTDANGHSWRAFEYLENTGSPQVASTVSQAYATAHTFASFTAAFGSFDTSLLAETIPGFHDLGYRYQQFEQALRIALPERKQKAREAIAALTGRQQYKNFYATIVSSPAHYPKRVMHHDAKIANVLFNKTNSQVVCPVDFDTLMPGYFFSDLGDMIRSMACNEDENCTDLSTLRIRDDFYESVVNGYLEVMGPHLTREEMDHIHYAGILMIYMQALRFLTDYLNGDIYYHIDYAEQNLNRANNQLALLEQLEIHLKFPEPAIAVHHFPEK